MYAHQLHANSCRMIFAISAHLHLVTKFCANGGGCVGAHALDFVRAYDPAGPQFKYPGQMRGTHRSEDVMNIQLHHCQQTLFTAGQQGDNAQQGRKKVTIKVAIAGKLAIFIPLLPTFNCIATPKTRKKLSPLRPAELLRKCKKNKKKCTRKMNGQSTSYSS